MNTLSAASAAALAAAGSLAALAAGYASLCGIELVRGASFMGRLATFAACFTGLFGIELVRCAFLMSSPASLPGFFRIELVRGSLLMSGLAPLAGNRTLLFLIHGSKTPLAGTRVAIPPLLPLSLLEAMMDLLIGNIQYSIKPLRWANEWAK